MKIKTDLIPISAYGESELARRRGILLDKVTSYVDHDTGNPYSTAQGNVNYFKNSYNKASASAHIFIDDKEAIMCIPAFENAERAHHVLYNIELDNKVFGDDSNDCAIGLELCYFPNDVDRTRKAYENYISVAVDLCLFHNSDPMNRMGHFELDPNRKTDPNNALKVIGLTYEDMKNDIKEAYVMAKIKSWQQELGEKSIDDLAKKGFVQNAESWKNKDLENEKPDLWLFFTMLSRITDK